MLSASKYIQKLWETGHYYNEDFPTGLTYVSPFQPDVESDGYKQVMDELSRLSLTSEPTQQAIFSYQQTHAGVFNFFAAKHKDGKPGRADGIFGPATAETLEQERCRVPDYGIEAANGQGSWPAGCTTAWPQNHTFTVNVDKQNMPSFLGDKDDPDSLFEQCWTRVREAYADMGIVFIRKDGDTRANTTITFTRGNGWIGLAIVPSRFSCDLSIWAKFDVGYKPSALFDQWCRLLAHELGHNMGWGHITGGIMNPYIVSGEFTRTAWRGDPTEPRAVKAFGGEPIDLYGDNDDEPKPKPNRIWIKGEAVVMQDNEELGEFIQVHKRRV